MPTHPKVNMVLFADYTIFYASNHTFSATVKKLYTQIDIALPWFNHCKITANPLKTNAIRFTNKPSRDTVTTKFSNIYIQWSKTVKYLGITTDDKLNFTYHTKKTLFLKPQILKNIFFHCYKLAAHFYLKRKYIFTKRT